MYTERVKTIYVQKSKILFKDSYGIPLDQETEVGDVGLPLSGIGNNPKYAPDYLIKGFFRKIDHNSRNEFTLHSDGPDAILVTGVPKEYPSLEPFRFKNTLFSSYWQDTVKGVLFQVLHEPAVLLPYNKQSIIQLS